MIEIPLSAAVEIAGSAEAFHAAVWAHRAALEAHRLGPPGEAAPFAPALLDALVERVPDINPIVAERQADRFVVADFEIVDDTPPPPTLAERKAALLHALQLAAQAAREAIISPARLQLLNFDVADALAVSEDNRAPAQVAAIGLWTAYNLRCGEIARNAARAAVAIEDLTEATIDGYKLPAL